MKSNLTLDEFNAITSADLKGEYELESGGNRYVLKIEGTTGADHPLFKARDNEKSAKEAALRERDTARQEVEKIKSAPPADETAAEKARREALEAKHAEELKKVQDDLAARDAGLIESARDKEISSIAAELFTTPGRDQVHLTGRVSVEIKDGKPIVTLLDKSGKGTTREALTKEFRDNQEFRGIVAAPKGNGGGAPIPGASGGGAPDATKQPGAKTDLTTVPAKDLVAHLKSKGVGADATA